MRAARSGESVWVVRAGFIETVFPQTSLSVYNYFKVQYNFHIHSAIFLFKRYAEMSSPLERDDLVVS